MSKIDLYNGDCLKLMKNISEKSVDCVICDLPYGVTEYEWDKIINGKELFAEYKRVCKQNANVLLFCQIKFAKYLMCSTYPTEFSHCLIWVKGNKTRHLSVDKLPMSQYEMILCFRINKYDNKERHKALRQYFTDELKKVGYQLKKLKKRYLIEVPIIGFDFRLILEYQQKKTIYGFVKLQDYTKEIIKILKMSLFLKRKIYVLTMETKKVTY